MDAAELQSEEDGRDGREVPGDMILRRVNYYNDPLTSIKEIYM